MKLKQLLYWMVFASAMLTGTLSAAQTGGTFEVPGAQNPWAASRPAAAASGVLDSAGGSRRPDQASPQSPSMQSPTLNGRQTSPDGRALPPSAAASAPEPKPLPPSVFARFVEAATGQLLPVFGTSFFEGAASSGIRDNGPVAGDYELGPGDEVVIRAWGSIDVDYRATVDRNGQISLPKVGSFTVAGVKASEIERHLRAQIGRLYTNFTLNVTLGQLRGLKVFVVGPAQRPGVLNLQSPATLLSAVVAAGGPAPYGSMRKVQLKRDGRVVTELDVYDFLVQGDKSRDIQLASGDVVVFQPVGARVALTGSIDLPRIYELKGAQESVGDVLRYAGGLPALVNPHRAQLERVDAWQAPAARFVESFALDAAGLSKPLRDGDVLSLSPISPQFANAVTLTGHVAQPYRYNFQPGMRIRDLIPNREALVSVDFHKRKNALVQLLQPVVRRPSSILFDELNWDYAVIERLNLADLSTQIIPFNLGKAVLQNDPANNLELRAGDVVTVFGQTEVRVPVERQTRIVTLEGEVATPGIYQLQAGETLKGLIARAGGFTKQAYVFGLDFSREETRKRQRENLAEAVARLEALAATQAARTAANRIDDTAAAAAQTAAAGNAATQAQLSRLSRIQPNGRIALELDPTAQSLDALPDLPLEGGDRIVVPTRPGFVTVTGAVSNNNARLWKPGRSAADYLRLAGLEEAGDPSNIFVLRADGTVVNANERRGLFGGGSLESLALYPGDALVVPNQLDFETWGRGLVRNLKDFSQIFANFGLGAAAIKTLRN